MQIVYVDYEKLKTGEISKMGYGGDKAYSRLKPVGNTPLGEVEPKRKRSTKKVDSEYIEEALTKVTEGEKQRQHQKSYNR